MLERDKQPAMTLVMHEYRYIVMQSKLQPKMDGSACAALALELPVVLSMTRLKAFRLPKGSSFSFTCHHMTVLAVDFHHRLF